MQVAVYKRTCGFGPNQSYKGRYLGSPGDRKPAMDNDPCYQFVGIANDNLITTQRWLSAADLDRIGLVDDTIDAGGSIDEGTVLDNIQSSGVKQTVQDVVGAAAAKGVPPWVLVVSGLGVLYWVYKKIF